MNYLRPTLKLFTSFALLLAFTFSPINTVEAQQFSTARVWNEMVLKAIRSDFARPTVHARNLYHTSLAMYEAFAAYDDVNQHMFLGQTLGDYTCEFEGVPVPDDIDKARSTAISYAVYRILQHRFEEAPLQEDLFYNIDLIFSAYQFDPEYTDTDYTSGNPAALGNYIAQSIIEYGYTDGSNEIDDYANKFYEPLNADLNPFNVWYNPVNNFGNPRMVDPNRWQKLDIPDFVGQNGQVDENGVPPFLGPEWGFVTPFALTEADKSVKEREGNEYWLYHDPGAPAYLDTVNGEGTTKDFIWGFSMTAHWKTHTIQDTNLLWDISPGNLGNHTELPKNMEETRAYYNFEEGGDYSKGHALNPHTGAPYEPQFVPRADYTRVLAEFWADGPASETPPGHWFTILNYVNDQEELIKKYKGEGPVLSDLEWDVKAYLALGGAMHDAAISAWSAKGYYDYVRPVSAIRYLVDKGQSTDPSLPNYDPTGIMLLPGSIELILEGDPLLFFDQSNLGQVKILSNTFEEERYFFNPSFWLPYQSPNFVTPPFAGYVSGHSTFSRAAAEVLERLTNDKFFPGGMGEFHFEENEYLEFGDPGPSKDMTLQWATYIDAANQSALSRIWGGIHPPIDDIPGRIIGVKVGQAAFDKADELFGLPTSTTDYVSPQKTSLAIFPNPVTESGRFNVSSDLLASGAQVTIVDAEGKEMFNEFIKSIEPVSISLGQMQIQSGLYHLMVSAGESYESTKLIVIK